MFCYDVCLCINDLFMPKEIRKELGYLGIAITDSAGKKKKKKPGPLQGQNFFTTSPKFQYLKFQKSFVKIRTYMQSALQIDWIPTTKKT